MGQPGFFDAEKRLAALSKKGDPQKAISASALVSWESFRADIETVALTPDAERRSHAGHKPFDAILMFRMLILQPLYNLSDEQIEWQVRDRMSVTRFIGLDFEDDIPDGTTLLLFRGKLAQAGFRPQPLPPPISLALDQTRTYPSATHAALEIRIIEALWLMKQLGIYCLQQWCTTSQRSTTSSRCGRLQGWNSGAGQRR